MINLFENATQKNVMFDELSEGASVQANQHLIVRNGEAIVLDPGGHKIYAKLFAEAFELIGGAELKYIFVSHQDPDIVAAINGWLMTTSATAWGSELWLRFIPHFGVDELVVDRLRGIPDEGMLLDLGGTELKIIPAHFLHSSGNHQIYDTVSKILYTGDMGASIGQSYSVVEDFDAHIQYMEGFHRRYMPSSRAIKIWANTVRQLDIAAIAPQHGAVFGTPEMSQRFIDWAESLDCGADLMNDSWPIP